MTLPTQREKIFRFISNRKQVTAQEVANWFKMPVASARFHIRILLQEGRIMVAKTKRVRQLGKPRTIYQPIERDDFDIYRSLLDELLSSELLVDRKKDDVIELFTQQVLAGPERRGSNLTLNLIDLIDRLNERGYDARWEVHRNAPNVILQDCPYEHSICRQTHFCEMDRRVISAWTKRAVKTVKTFATGERISGCVFEIE